MARQVNAAGIAIAAASEGTVYTAYRDPTGKLTAGQGHTGPDVVAGVTYTQAQVDAWRIADMAKAAAFVESRVRVPLSDNQFSALAEFTFNVGVGNFAGSTLLRLLNKRVYTAIPAQLARWNKGRVDGVLTVLPGLVTRRAHEAALFATPATHTVLIVPANDNTKNIPGNIPALVTPVAPSLIERARAWLHTAVNP